MEGGRGRRDKRQKAPAHHALLPQARPRGDSCRVNTASVERGVLAPPPIFPRWGLAPVGAMRWGALSVVLTAFAVAFEAPARRFAVRAPSRVVAVRSYVEARSGTFGSYVEGLEDKCSSGDDEACQLLDQLSGYARSLEDLRSRRSRAPDAPDISAAAPAFAPVLRVGTEEDHLVPGCARAARNQASSQ